MNTEQQPIAATAHRTAPDNAEHAAAIAGRWKLIHDWLEGGGDDYAIRGSDQRFVFNMDTWLRHTYTRDRRGVPVCGTVCCIGGFAEAMVRFEHPDRENFRIGGGELDAWLGMTGEGASEMFSAGPYDMRHVTASWAARTVKHYIETGYVDWVATR